MLFQLRLMNTGLHINHEESLSKGPEIGGFLFIEKSSCEELNEDVTFGVWIHGVMFYGVESHKQIRFWTQILDGVWQAWRK